MFQWCRTVKFFLVLFTAAWVGGVGDSAHTVMQGFTFIPPVHQHLPHVVSKAGREWERMGDHTQEICMGQAWKWST